MNWWRTVALVGAALALAACRSAALPELGPAPLFELTAQDGEPFSSSVLAGRVWVADFIFTNCNGPCPMMTALMARLTRQTPASVQFVSFTVDPVRDTPAALAAFAAPFHPDYRRWHFLTGAPEALNAVGLAGFRLNSVDGALEHSTRFALVDRRGQVRGYYSSAEADEMDRLLKDIRRLESET